MNPLPTHTLPRSRRIQRSGEFVLLKTEGERAAQGTLIANWRDSMPGADSRLGVVTSRRIGGAVVRNRARRLMREAFRQARPEFLRPVDLILVARPSIKGRNQEKVSRDFRALMQRARILSAPDSSSPGVPKRPN